MLAPHLSCTEFPRLLSYEQPLKDISYRLEQSLRETMLCVAFVLRDFGLKAPNDRPV